MARRSYVPNSDSGFRTWAESLASCIAGEPEKYRFSPEEAAQLVDAVRGFSEALQAVCNPWTRTRPLVAQKQEARVSCERMCRRIAMVIKHDPSISDADKIGAGIRVDEPRRRRR